MKNVSKIITLLMLCLLSTSIKGQFSIYNKGVDRQVKRIDIDSTFYSSSNIYEISNGSISGLCITANIELYNYESYIRIILIDLDYDKEYLVYNAYYPMNSINTKYNIEKFAYETNMLYNVSNAIVKIEINNAECFVGNILYSTYQYNNRIRFDTDKNLQKHIQDSLIVKSMNERILNDDMIWVAGETSISKMFYDEKRSLLPKNDIKEIPNLQGLEYYTGGIFILRTDSVAELRSEESNYVDDFDWRNKHGVSWITPSKQQDCNQCWVFCPTSVAESSVNLYFNRHIDYDLSEQNIASCSGGNIGNCEGGYINYAIDYLVEQGIVTEDCFLYEGEDATSVPCSSMCDAPYEIISFSTYHYISKSVDNIKKSIILNGPICGGISNIWHFMSIIGFKKIKNGDIIYNGNGSSLSTITINETSPYLNQTCWLFKNSWGSNWGDNGCGYIITNTNNLYGLYELTTPKSLQYDNNDILCVDIDGDGYYNWGIGEKPSNCPNCPDERDSDDHSALFGPYNDKFESVILCENYIYSEIPEHISNSKTWCTKKYINHDVIIDNGCVLTITDTIYLGESVKVIVKPGGKLILENNSLLTSLCDTKWQGIQVWGIDSLHQTFVTNCPQGFLQLKNGAVIENAVCAVDLCDPSDNHGEGGVVQATDAIFRNNAKAVRALNYSNYNPNSGLEEDNISCFRGCTFVIDSAYIGDETFQTHVELTNVDGIKFYGCDFSVAGEIPQVADYNMAVLAYNAGFIVDSDCNSPMIPCPSSQMTRSTFTGFSYAVNAIGDGSSARTFSVSNSSFSDNERGICAENTNYATIIKNDFTVGSDAACNYGIYLSGVTGFCVEENGFTRNTSVSNRTYGIAVDDSRGYNNIYLNHFHNLYCGNLAIGTNVIPGLSGSVGLTYSCNTNSGNTNDFGVLKKNSSGDIGKTQGSPSVGAGNTFSGSNYHFYNGGNTYVTYYYNGSNNECPSRMFRLTRANATKSNGCESHYNVGGGGDIAMSSEETDSLKNLYGSLLAEYNSLRRVVTGEKNDDTASLAKYESDLLTLRQAYMQAAGDIIRSNLAKEEKDVTELREWLGRMDDMNSDRMMIATYIHEGDFANAIAIAKTLPDKYGLQGDDLSEHLDYMEIIRLHERLHETGRTAQQLGDSEISLLEDISGKGDGPSRMMARAIVDESRGIPTFAPTQCPTIPAYGAETRGNSQEKNMMTAKELDIVISPNPATTVLEVKYTLPEDEYEADLVMINSLGMKVMSAKLYGEEGTATLDLGHLPAGMYFYDISCGEHRMSGKMIKR